MIAGDYISDYKAVKQVVTMAPEQIKELVQWGVNFDKQQDGKFDLHREGGHSEFRILHHADDTGAEIQRGLMEAVRNCPDIDIKENHFAVEIITQHHLGARVTRRTPYINCYGAYVLNPDTQKVDTYLSKVTVMCTGGCGAVYQTTTNPVIATGDGEAMVYRAKGTVADMEFVQFHPTALYHPGETHPAFLITEAMRGYGGILRLPNGESFMEKYDKRLSLAPRDICLLYTSSAQWCYQGEAGLSHRFYSRSSLHHLPYLELGSCGIGLRIGRRERTGTFLQGDTF